MRESVFGGILPTALVCGLGLCALFGDCFRSKSIMEDDVDTAVDEVRADAAITYRYELLDAGVQTPVDLPIDGGLIFTNPIFLQPPPLPDAGTHFIFTNVDRPITKVLSVQNGGREIMWFGKTPGAIWPIYHGVIGEREWNDYLSAENDATDYSRIYVRQPDAGAAFIERTDAGVWIAHGITCAP